MVDRSLPDDMLRKPLTWSAVRPVPKSILELSTWMWAIFLLESKMTAA